MKTQLEVVTQIDTVLREYERVRSSSNYNDCSDYPEEDLTALVTSMCACIKRFEPLNSYYIDSMAVILGVAKANNYLAVNRIAGVLKALRSAYDNGYLTTINELIHADIFTDFIEMADYLLSEGYKDPAAVIIGSVLEEHLRQLSIKNGATVTNAGKPKKADQLNNDLAGKAVYSKLDQKSITSWLDLRNKAAHGKYNEYSKEQVKLLLDGVQNFMTRVPA
jgi:hypothetical protein